jgi:hypothetical protein
MLRMISEHWNQQQDEKAYRVYISDAIMTLTETVAKAFGGKYIGHRYIDYIDPPKPEENRGGEEIIADISTKLERMGGDGT